MMLRSIFAVLAVIMAAGCTTGPAPAPAHVCPAPLPCTPILSRVVDGDTVDVTAAGLPVRLRLYGVNTPERGQPGFAAAARYTRDWLAEASSLRYTVHGHDSFNRPLVTIHRTITPVADSTVADPIPLNRALILASHAVEYHP